VAQDEGVEVSTGTSTSISIERVFSYRLAEPYGKCLPTDISKIDFSQNDVLKFMYDDYIDGSYYQPIHKSIWLGPQWNWTLVYNQYFCLKMCYQKYLYSQCGCYDITIPFTPKKLSTYLENACTKSSEIECLRNRLHLFYNNENLFGPCYVKCPIECDHIEYQLEIFTSTYPTEWYANVLATNPKFNKIINRYFDVYNKTSISYVGNFASLRNAVARVNVFYRDLSFIQIDESPAMTFDLFLGALGGNLGLFLGKRKLFSSTSLY
jgi:hypothetical protein